MENLGVEFTKEMYYNLLEKQQGVCAICGGVERVKGKTINLSVDHDHKTGKIRDLLCGNCNRGIGLLKDDSQTLMKACLYLKNNES